MGPHQTLRRYLLYLPSDSASLTLGSAVAGSASDRWFASSWQQGVCERLICAYKKQMEDETAQSEAVSTFCAITGAAPAVAEHYLDSCSWNVERAVDMFFTSPPGEQTNVPDSPGRAANAGMSEEDARAAAAALQDDDLGLDHAQRSEPMHDMGVRAAISVAPAPAGTSAARRAPRVGHSYGISN
jgi:hypothetical protein